MRTINYYRVSTAKQGRSGLGLEAQRQRLRASVLAEDVSRWASTRSKRAASGMIGRSWPRRSIMPR